VRPYDSAAVLGQRFLTDFEGTATGDPEKIVSAFPSFGVARPAAFHQYRSSSRASRRGFLNYAGEHTGSEFKLGEWGAADAAVGTGLAGTGPLCVFDENLGTSIVLSPFSSFMAASQLYDGARRTLSYGVMGNVSRVPAGFALETVVVASRGINEAMVAWGDALLARSAKPRDGAWDGRDVTLQYLGYSTDNGAFYYYNMEPHQNYETTMLDVAAYARDEKIPYKYWLADSWWYFKGVDDGVKNWTAMPSVFPRGLEYVWEQTGWLVQGHNRYWASDVDYARQNGGRWDFLVDAASNRSLPVDEGFWDFLMRSSKRWGLAVYEQDWLDTEFSGTVGHGGFPPLTQSATLATTWLRQMANAAAANGLAIQYCMSYARHILASTELPAVTQARASTDYHPGAGGKQDNGQWQPLGVTAIFAYAAGLAPSKDTYWSTQYQPGHPARYGDGASEPYTRLQAAVTTLTKGPVCPSDGVNRSDVPLIMRAAMADGTLLAPQRPATKLDTALVAAALGGAAGPRGEVWWAPSVVAGRTYGALFVANLTADHKLTPDELRLGLGAHQLVAVEANASGVAVGWGAEGETGGGGGAVPPPPPPPLPLPLRACGRYDFQLWSVAPREASGWALLGEVSTKWVAVSPARFVSVSASDDELAATIRGASGEAVEVAFAAPPTADGGAGAVVTVTCVVPLGGAARVVMPASGEGRCEPA